MHMKHLHLLKIRSAAATLYAAVLLCACSYEKIPDDDDSGGQGGELTTVTLKVGPAANEQNLTSKGLSDTEENAIYDLYTLAFQLDNGDYKLKYYATGKPGASGGLFSFSLRRSVSGVADTKLLLVANQNPYPLINTGMTYEGVQTALTSAKLTAGPAFADTGIPMFGFAGDSPNEPLQITEGMTLSAKLLRAVARVDVGVGTYNTGTGVWDKGSVNFDLTEIYVFKPQNKYTLIPLIDNLEYAPEGTPSVTAPSPAGTAIDGSFEYTGTTAITKNTYCKATIYIPEVDFGNGTVYDENHENRMALVIGGVYNGRTNYYRIDFTNQPTDAEGDQLQDVLRNRIYRFSITGVSVPGYTTAEAAYGGKPVELSFTTSITDWVSGAKGSPDPDMLVRMDYGGVNGAIIQVTGGGGLTVKEKNKDGFVADDGNTRAVLYYNSLLGEATDNVYNGTGNGGVYKSAQDALNREGPYKKLVIAPDNAGENIVWRSTEKDAPKRDRVLDAKKVCWDYRGQGHTDWRLPRLSELYLIWLNRATINQSKGFTSLGETSAAYWSASEAPNDKAYAVNSAGKVTQNLKTSQFMIRCVREIK